jgi:hypothetical protein
MDNYAIEPNQYTQDPRETDRRPFYTFVCVCAAAFGIFLWLKLKLVASVPKTAYAQPEEPRPDTSSDVIPEPSPDPTGETPVEIPLTATEHQLPPEAVQPDLIRVVPW